MHTFSNTKIILLPNHRAFGESLFFACPKRPLVSAPALAAFAHPCAAKGSLLLGFTS
jgi:hypothetical protein